MSAVPWWAIAGLGTAIAGVYVCVSGCARTKAPKPSLKATEPPSARAAPSEAVVQAPTKPKEDIPVLVAVLKGHTAGTVAVAWSPDGSILASTSSDRTLRLWLADEASLRARDAVVRRVNIQLDTPTQLAFNAQGTLLMGMESGTVRRLALLSERAADGSWTNTEAEFDLGHKEAPRAIVALSSGAVLSCGSGTVVRLHSATGSELASYDTHQVECYSFAASPDGTYIASASWSADVNVLELKGKPARFTPAFALPGHRRAVRAVAFGQGGHVATASADGTARLYRLRRPGEDPVLITSLPASTGSFQLASFSPNGSLLALGEAQIIVLISVDLGAEVRRWTAHDASVLSVAWSPDGSQLATAASGDRQLKVWKLT